MKLIRNLFAGLIVALTLAMLGSVWPIAPYVRSAAAQLVGVYTLGNGTTITGHLLRALGNTNAGAALAPPTISGTNCTAVGVTADSTDFMGSATNGTATTGCKINFGTAFAVAPKCIVQDVTTAGDSGVFTVSTTQISLGTIVSGDVINWICIGTLGN
jgi:hypothetical protein